jgi:hypothetical protein
MKKLYYLLFAFIFIVVNACSSDLDDELTTVSFSENEKYVPYISTQMQEILNMIDTCSTTIPIEKLVPYVDNMANNIISVPMTSTRTTDDGTTVAEGYSKYSVLYTNVKTTISSTQAENFNCNAGPYYITCYVITKYLSTNGEIINAWTNTDAMGINPDDLSERGYVIDEKKANTLYYLSTYVWVINSSDINTNGKCLPIINTISGYYHQFDTIYDFMSVMEWRYYQL